MTAPDTITITLKRKTAELVLAMLPSGSVLNRYALEACLELAQACDQALGRDVKDDIEEEEEPEYAPPR